MRAAVFGPGRRHNGPPSKFNLDENPEAETGEIVDVCSRLEKMSPEIGSGRVANAEYFLRAQSLTIELVGGRVCERILFPDHTPLRAEHDQIEASAFAAIACAAPQAASALIRYAEAEAECLIRENLHVVLALVAAIVDEGGTLSSERVDEIIAAATARESLQIELDRRSAWRSVVKNAGDFAQDATEQ